MDEKGSKDRRWVCIKRIEGVQERVIAAAGLLEAVHAAYVYEGTLSAGAVLHIIHVLDEAAAMVGAMENELQQDKSLE